MSVAVRYFSRSGNTKALAEGIAKAAGVKAISVDIPGSQIRQPVDVLFIGGALYYYGIDSHLVEFIEVLPAKHVKKAVVFSTSMISKHAVSIIKKRLDEKGIPVEEEYFYNRGKPDSSKLKEAEKFVQKYLK